MEKYKIAYTTQDFKTMNIMLMTLLPVNNVKMDINPTGSQFKNVLNAHNPYLND